MGMLENWAAREDGGMSKVERVAALHEECRADYQKAQEGRQDGTSGAFRQSDLIAGQRSANRTWGTEPQPSGDE